MKSHVIMERNSLIENADKMKSILSGMTPDQRLDALLHTDDLGNKYIVSCLHSRELLGIVIRYLTPAQWVTLLKEKHISGEPIFASVLSNFRTAEVLVGLLAPDQLIDLCMMPQGLSFNVGKRAIITNYVIKHYQNSDVMVTVRVILEALPYHDRLRFLNMKDESGTNLMEAVPNDQGVRHRYHTLITRLSSLTAEFKLITEMWKEGVKSHLTDKLKITSDAELFEVCQCIELKALLAYFEYDTKKTVESLQKQIKSVLAERYLNAAHAYLPVSQYPNSLTNQFCYEVIMLIFNPTNLAELISEFAGKQPQPLSRYGFNIPEVFPGGLSYREKIAFFRNSAPVIDFPVSLSSLTHLPPTLEALSSLIIHKNSVVWLHDINRYSLKRHIHLYQVLKQHYPEVAALIYTHNRHWRSLANDIETILKSGITPLEAVEAFIQGLKSGGEARTGDPMDAADVANEAVAKFVTYIEGLPTELKQQLEALQDSSGRRVLADLHQLLHQYSCVEQLSDALSDLITLNHDAVCLQINPGVAPTFLAELEKRCRVGIETKKEESVLMGPVPFWMAVMIFQRIDLSHLHHKIHRLNTTPNALIDPLFRFVKLDNPEAFFQRLALAIKDYFFKNEKRWVILAAIANHAKRVEFQPYLHHLQEAFHDFSNEPRAIELLKPYYLSGAMVSLNEMVNKLGSGPESNSQMVL